MLVDVVDGNNRVVSKAQRSEVLGRHLNFRTVHVLLQKGDRLFLQRLATGHLRSPNRLGSSAAGYLQANETYLEAAKRKLHEELDAAVVVTDIGRFDMLDESSRKFVGVFIGTAPASLKIADDQVTELVEMGLSDLDNLTQQQPDIFTPTFVLVYRHFQTWMSTRG